MAFVQALIEWAQLREKYIGPGIPFEQPLVGDPQLSLVFDPRPARLGLRLRHSNEERKSRLSSLQNVLVRNVLIGGAVHTEVLTESRDLFRPIYALIADVLSRVAEGQVDVLVAIKQSMEEFHLLLSGQSGMSREKAIGLYGELWVLRSLIQAGAPSVDPWVGADRQLHDFRLDRVDLEVKTTTANVRRHEIHGLNQLTPSPGRKLILVSLRLGHAGAEPGESLRDLAQSINVQIKGDSRALQRFGLLLSTAGYDAEHEECQVRYRLVAPAMSVSMDTDFPELSYAWLHQKLGDPASRIRDVQLSLDLEGLGGPFNPRALMEMQDE